MDEVKNIVKVGEATLTPEAVKALASMQHHNNEGLLSGIDGMKDAVILLTIAGDGNPVDHAKAMKAITSVAYFIDQLNNLKS